MNNFDTLLFDLDGTLIDSTRDLTTSINLLRRESGLSPLEQTTVAGYIGDGSALLVRRSLPPGRYSEAHLERFLDIYSKHLTDTTAPYPGIFSLLDACLGKAMAVVTNKPLKPTLILLDRLNLRCYFPVIIGGDSTSAKKPAPDPVAEALVKLGRDARSAIMIGDHANDLLAGRAAGVSTCFCGWGTGDHRGEMRDLEAATPRELQALLLDPAST
ncbi:MAG TPA: HAD-IA family hydrolase [Desulfuromonadales bacterium]|nr:HAD-IA family hydrolase [Desulfuromonadales bacterium]